MAKSANTRPAGHRSAASKKVTIHDVARSAKVSLATVSLVLQNKGKLRSETRDRVHEAISATGYQPRGRTVRDSDPKPAQYAFIVDDIGNPYFHALYKGIADNLPSENTVLTMLSSEDDVGQQDTVLRNLVRTGVDGLVVVPASGTRAKDFQALPLGKVALILAVRNIGHGSFNYIGANPMVGMMLATERLTALGHRDIAFVGGHPTNHAFGERYAGIAASLIKVGLTLPKNRILSGASTRAFGRDAALGLLQTADPPTAMIGYNDVVALGIMDAIVATGLTPGKDVAVIGYDNIPEAAQQSVPLTTVATPADKLGEVVARSLLNMSSDEIEDGAVDITYPPRLMIRSSCGSAKYGSKLEVA